MVHKEFFLYREFLYIKSLLYEKLISIKCFFISKLSLYVLSRCFTTFLWWWLWRQRRNSSSSKLPQRSLSFSLPPNHQLWYAKWKLSRNMSTLRKRFCTFGANLLCSVDAYWQNFCTGAQEEVYQECVVGWVLFLSLPHSKVVPALICTFRNPLIQFKKPLFMS